MTRIIAVANQKGGVGKTTTAVNLAAALAVAERNTLLIDIDPQGNATSGTGQDPGGLDRSIYHVLIGENTLPEVILPTDLPTLSLAPSNIDLIGAEIEMISLPGREGRLRQAIGLLAGAYDYVIIDCPPSLSLLTVNALTAAGSVVIPLQCEYFALEGLTQLMKTISLIKSSFNAGLSLEGILLTMFSSRTNLARQVAHEVREHFPDHVFQTVIPRNVRLSEAPSFGKPVLLYDIRSKGAEAYFSFAKEVISHEQKGTGTGAESPHPRY
jgi:chromosome partitioning protein